MSGGMDPQHREGDVIDGRYRIVGVLGHGGVGTTYEAEALADGSRVALKQLWLWHQHDWKVLELFQREVRVLASLSHPLVPRYLDSFQVETERGPCFYLAQELAAGRSLAARVAEGWTPSGVEARSIAERLIRVLEHLHRLVPPVIHRDVKPANVIRSDDGEIRLVDFGAVRDTFRTLAQGSTVVGTFGYMAPEQLHGHAVPATDLYGLGATLVFLLTRTPPSSLPQQRGRPVWRNRARVSRPFAAFVDKLLAPVPEDRFQSALQARLALQRVEKAESPSRARVALAVALGLVAVSAVVVALAWPMSHGSPSLVKHAAAATLAQVDRRVPGGRLRFVRALKGNVGPVMDVAWTPDSKLLVSAGMDGSVRLWDAASGKQVRVYAGHSGRVDSVAISPDGHKLFTGSFDSTVRIWDLDTGAQLRKLTDHGSRVSSVAVSRDGKLLASADESGRIIIHDVSTGRPLRTMSQPPKAICLQFGQGNLLASGGDDGPIRLWNAATGKLQAKLAAHQGPVDRVVFTPDGQTLVSSGDDHTLRVWAVGARHLARTIRDHTDEVWALALSPDGKLVASAGKDRVIVVEDLLDKGLRARRENGDEYPIPSLEFSPDGKLLAVGGASSVLRLWELTTPTWRPPWVKAPVPRVEKKEPAGLSKSDKLCFQAEKLLHTEMNDAAARPLLLAALAADPKSARALVDMGRLEYKLGYRSGDNYDLGSLVRAHKLFDRALAIAPNMYEAHLYKAYAYMFQKNYDDAAKQAAIAEKIKPDDPRTQVLYIEIGQARKDANEILLHARALIETSSDPLTLAAAYDGLKTVYAQRSEWDAEERCYTSIINLEPDSAWAKGNYGDFLIFRGEYDRAIAMAKEAIKQADYGMAHVTLASAYAYKGLKVLHDSGDRAAAKKLIDRGLAESRYSAPARYALGMYDRNGGDEAAAERELKEALKLDPSFERARRALGDKAPPRPAR